MDSVPFHSPPESQRRLHTETLGEGSDLGRSLVHSPSSSLLNDERKPLGEVNPAALSFHYAWESRLRVLSGEVTATRVLGSMLVTGEHSGNARLRSAGEGEESPYILC